jgi:tRNA A37 threonylcarbamoyladenosine synthetase subunit TsaC/SUA5/YrdC
MDPDFIYLAQTDTTVGLLSQHDLKLVNAKKRAPGKSFIKAFDSLGTLKSNIKIQKKHRKTVRRATRTTFLAGLETESFRVIKDSAHRRLVSKFGWLYTTSANESTKEFNLTFVVENSDVMVLFANGYASRKPSMILKLLKEKIKKVRG